MRKDENIETLVVPFLLAVIKIPANHPAVKPKVHITLTSIQASL